MEFQHLLPFLTFLFLAVVVSHAALSPEAYWKSLLPNTPMPKTVKDLLHSELMEEKGTSVQVGKGGVNVGTGNGKPGDGTSVNVGHKGIGVSTGKPSSKGPHISVGKGGVSVGTGRKGKPVYVGAKPGPKDFEYQYAATKDQLHDNPNVALFFLEKNMKPGAKMTLHFTKTTAATTFLPREAAEKIPFSSNNFPEILNHFSINSQSLEAQMMKKTIEECDGPGIKGEEKYCATSLESMVDFSTSKLGKNVNAISTEVQTETQTQEYGIAVAKRMGRGESAVVCHKQNYAYAVFYCHKSQTTRAYLVSLLGRDGTKAKAVAVCHTDTSAWNPKHLAFQVLKIEPGTVPVCHFLPEDHLVWVPY